MLVREVTKPKENSMVSLTVSKRSWRVTVSTVSTEVSVSQSLVSLPTEPPISECTIPEEPSSSPTPRTPTSSWCGPSPSSSLWPLVSSHIPLIPSEEDSWCSLAEAMFSTEEPLTALIKSINKKDPQPSSRVPSQTFSEEPVVLWCLSSTIRSKVSFSEELTLPIYKSINLNLLKKVYRFIDFYLSFL